MVQAVKSKSALTLDKKQLLEALKIVYEGGRTGTPFKDVLQSIEFLIDEESRKAVEEGMEEYLKGKTKSFDDVEEAITWLKSGKD